MSYVHGYDSREAVRLADQANTLVELLHHDTAYPAGSTVLEAGCGVGAQTVTLARNSPQTAITAIDIAESSLEQTRAAVAAARLSNVVTRQADIFSLPFAEEAFDHVFVCFVLEHVARPIEALLALKRVLKPGGTITVIEGDHGSTLFHPDSIFARRCVDCLIALQARAGGNGLIGRELFPLLAASGFNSLHVSPRMVYVDAGRPQLVDGFTRRTFTAMVKGVREDAIAQGLTTAGDFDRGIADLYRAAQEDGTFCYTFFKGIGTKK